MTVAPSQLFESLGIPYLSPPKQKIEQKFEKGLEKNSAYFYMELKSDCC